ncbi:MAG: GTPase HflX [Candidatus Eisenbacteria sp.]|nr:GTPase HflX [Candidatus Eisenbacteria bacterium]
MSRRRTADDEGATSQPTGGRRSGRERASGTGRSGPFETAPRAERALLVGLSGNGRGEARRGAGIAGPVSPPAGEGLGELAQLAEAAGSEVVGRLFQRPAGRRPGTFLSKGKLEELGQLADAQEADLIIFDENLSPVQTRNLQESLQRKVLDRTELILDIFATRARTREAQLQVELAQLQYLLPRLTRMWVHLSRLGGGIGTRGPGETQLEVDRRRVRQRISALKRRLVAVERERAVQQRRRREMFRVSLIGYTNAGKSTLFNALTHATVPTEDKLFATLDTTTRRLVLESGEVLLLSDTVGFIRKLPHHLVASFRATLREVREADLLAHVVDASHPCLREQMAAVGEVLDELLDGHAVRQIVVLNKADLLSETERLALATEIPCAVMLAATDPGDVARFRDHLAQASRGEGWSARRGGRCPRAADAVAPLPGGGRA